MTNQTQNKNGWDLPGCIFGTLFGVCALGLIGSGLYAIFDKGKDKGRNQILSQPIYQKNIEGKVYLSLGGNSYIQINDSIYIPYKEFQSQELENLNAQRENIENKLKGGTR